MSLESWLRQPTTITGLASLLGTLAGAAAHVATGDTNVAAGAGAVAFAATHLIIDDNSVAEDARKIVQTGVTAAAGGPVVDGQLAAQLTTEMVNLVRDVITGKLQPPASPPPPAAS